MLIRRIRRVLRDAGRNMEGATLNLLKRTNTAGKDGTEQMAFGIPEAPSIALLNCIGFKGQCT